MKFNQRLAVAVLSLALSATAITAGADTPGTRNDYQMSIIQQGGYAHPTDTPAFSYIHADGSLWFQQSAALYGPNDPRYWEFYTGKDFVSATRSPVSDAVNPANSLDRNNDTTWRCNNSPTGREATASAGYIHPNYCDLVGLWVDPDSGDWYGLIHNEFTGQPFGDGLHFDGIDSAVSRDQGKTWSFLGHVITSPYSTTRGDTEQFPGKAYNYGDGDPRLYVDQASGYFYVYYGSRVLPKGGGGAGSSPLAHAARAKMSDKFAPGSFTKWYDGTWSQPGIGGKESNMTPILAEGDTGYTPVGDDYDPSNLGTVAEQQAAGEVPLKSSLFVMNVTYNAYLGLYIGSPENGATDPRETGAVYYATDNLTTNRWYPIAQDRSWQTGWYRWFIDDRTLATGQIVGRDFRAYCSIECTGGAGGIFATTRITPKAGAVAPIDLTKSYAISNADGLHLSAVNVKSAATRSTTRATEATQFTFVATNDGAYLMIDNASGRALGVDASSNAGRAWGARPRLQALAAAGPTSGQEWFIVANTDPSTGTHTGTIRLVNRYSGLDLALTSTVGREVETAPGRAWTDGTAADVGAGRTANQQTLTVTAVGEAAHLPAVSRITTQTWKEGSAVSLAVEATSAFNEQLTFAAEGLPAGVTMDAMTGAFTGTVATPGEGTATVKVSSASASVTRSFDWSVIPNLDNVKGAVTTGSNLALEVPGASSANAAELAVATANGSAQQEWTFLPAGDGSSYLLKNTATGQCVDDSTPSATPGHPVIQWPCEPNNVNQQWMVRPGAAATVTLVNVESGLRIQAEADVSGSPVTQEVANDSALQLWVTAR